MKFKAPIEVQSGISDGDPTNPLGVAGYLLSSDGSNVSWVSPGELSAETAEAVVQPIKAYEALTKGDPLYIVGYQTGQDVNIVGKADSNVPSKMPAVGVADADYSSQAFGTMTAFGSFNGNFDTTGGTENWSIGDIIFVKSGGGLTNVKPVGDDLIQNIAIVSRVQQNTGELEVIALGRTNDVPNLPEGRLFVGTAANTSKTSDVVYVDDTNDRVGIGTNIPAVKLHVGKTSSSVATTEEFRIQTGTGGGYGGNAVVNLLTGNYGNSGIYFGDTPTYSSQPAYIEFQDSPGTLTYKAPGSGSHIFKIGTSVEMLINSAGNVGIGETTMSDKLSLKNGTANTAIRINSFNNAVGTESAIKFASVQSSASYAKGGIVFRNTASSYGRGDMHFLNDNATDSGNANTTDDTAMIIKQSGDVGIGTTNPQEKLHVNEAIPGNTLLEVENVRNNSTAGVKLTSASASYVAYTDAASDFAIFNNQTGKVNFKILDDGRVFIGVGNPTTLTEDVEIGGSVKATASTDAYKGYIKQTITSSANEKADNADYNLIPYNTLTTTSGNQSYNRMVAAYDGRIKKVYIRNTSGTVTADTVNFKKQVNNTTAATVYSATVANAGSAGMSAVYNFADNDFTFNEGDTFGILYQTVNSGGGARKMAGVAINIIVEYNIT